jgi:pimeloyl-ACP methyl ester carboxylesterase
MTEQDGLFVKVISDFAGRLVEWAEFVGWICAVVFIAAGCATPIGVNYVDRSVAYHSLTGNVLSAERPIGRQRLGIFMLHPHKTGRIPVVLVHGTASSPARWAEMVNELENDPGFWEHYEIWLFMYNTGNPIAYSAMLLREALTKAVAELDPAGKDPGLKQMVVIGHSQGGLLTKMTAIDSGMTTGTRRRS